MSIELMLFCMRVFLEVFFRQCCCSWAPAKFFQKRGGGAQHLYLKKLTRFRRTENWSIFCTARRKRVNLLKVQTKIVAFLRRFRLNYSVMIASAHGASQNFRVFCSPAAYDVIFVSNPRGRGRGEVLLPLRAPICCS